MCVCVGGGERNRTSDTQMSVAPPPPPPPPPLRGMQLESCVVKEGILCMGESRLSMKKCELNFLALLSATRKCS